MVSTAIFILPSSASSPSSSPSRVPLSTHSVNPIFPKFNSNRFRGNPLILKPNSVVQFIFKVPNASSSSLSKPSFRTVMEMQDCTVKMEVDVPVSVAYNCYLDREAMPQWMPFISSVKILEDKPDQSRWTLKYKAFGRNIEFSWLARNLQPIPNQKIHWRSVEGLRNSGAVRFYPKGPSSCMIELTVSYEVPPLLAPVASALQPFLQSLLLRGLERFPKFARSYNSDSVA